LAARLVFRYPEDTRPTSLLPFFAEDMSSVRMVELIFDSLVIINKRGDLEGSLATSWKADPDNQIGIRFVLREGVKWHDGKPFTADDVVFTVQAAQDPKTVFNAKSKFSFIRDGPPKASSGCTSPSTGPSPSPSGGSCSRSCPSTPSRRPRSAARTSSAARPSAPAPTSSTRTRLRSVSLDRQPRLLRARPHR
jgi:peptide/nickel transport system substrate-binding protein